MPRPQIPIPSSIARGRPWRARLAFLCQALTENRCGLLIHAFLTPAHSHAKRLAALATIEPRADCPVAVTFGAEKRHAAANFANELRSMNVHPHVAQNTTRRFGLSAIDGRTIRPAGYLECKRVRKRIEEAFGRMESVGGTRRRMLCDADRVGWTLAFAAAVLQPPKTAQAMDATA